MEFYRLCHWHNLHLTFTYVYYTQREIKKQNRILGVSLKIVFRLKFLYSNSS